MISYASIAAMRLEGSGREFTYLKTSLAEQTSLEVLFSPEETEDWQLSECFQKLHIEEKFLNMEITEEAVDFFMDVVEALYQNGHRTMLPAKEADEEERARLKKTRKQVTEFKAATEEEYKQEAEGWYDLYEYSGRSVDLYQSSRALKDALEVGANKDFEAMLRIAADAVNRSERFLEFEDRNINTKENAIVKNAGDIALSNAKVYWQLARRSKIGNEEERAYTNAFLMLAYACAGQAEQQMDIGHRDYAKALYYKGNTGEQILKRISQESPLYQEMGEQVLRDYESALSCLISRPGYYNQEEAMEKNINNGIAKLSGFRTETGGAQ